MKESRNNTISSLVIGYYPVSEFMKVLAFVLLITTHIQSPPPLSLPTSLLITA